MKPRLTACFALCLLATKLSAATLRVPAEHARIQSAVDAAKAGDTVLVAAGTYRERVTLKAGVTLRSAGDDAPGKLGLTRAEATVIDGGGTPEPRGVIKILLEKNWVAGPSHYLAGHRQPG